MSPNLQASPSAVAQQPQVGHGHLIVEVSLPHSYTPQSVTLLRTSDQPVAETSCLTTHNTYNRQTSMPLAGFELAIPASGRSLTHALEQCFSTFVRPRPGKFFFQKTRARSQQIYPSVPFQFFLVHTLN